MLMGLTPPRKKPPSQRGNRAVKEPRVDNTELNDPRHIALHEAGHAVAAVVLGLSLRKVELKRRVIPQGISVGFTDSPVEVMDVAGKGEEAAMPRMIQIMAGPVAEMRENEDVVATGAFQHDMDFLRRVAAVATLEATQRADGRMEIPPDVLQRNKSRLDQTCASALHRADELVAHHWQAILAVRDALLGKGELSGHEVAAIVRDCPPDRQ
jgi:hypothetical protein